MILAGVMDWRKVSPSISTNTGCIRSTKVAADPFFRAKTMNLTVRHGLAALARRTRTTAQQSPHLLAHLEWWRAYYHFVRPHASLRVAQRYRQRTPAVAAGRTDRRWTAREVLCHPLPQMPCIPK